MRILTVNNLFNNYVHPILQPNLGEDALLYTQLQAISKVAPINSEVTILSKFNADISHYQEMIPSLKLKVLSYETKGFLGRYIGFLKKNWYTVTGKYDVITDVRGGDSFSDLYGKSNSLIRSIMFAMKLFFAKCTFILLPQTIGPFFYRDSKFFAKYIIKHSTLVFTRDQKSIEYIKSFLPDKQVICVTDMAFRLPYTRRQWADNGKIKVGINASGLLARFKNNARYSNINLDFDYNDFIKKLIERFINLVDVEVHIIPHVITTREDMEDNDLYLSQHLAEEYPQVILSDIFTTSIEAKNYISSMDFFIGSRMHATIAAVSSEVPTIPMGYSRKFTGLFGNLDYPYILDLQSENDVDIVVEKCVELFKNRNELKEAAINANVKAQHLLDVFEAELCKVFNEVKK
jgi:polysaccharide pyruvyl transferase WcaK-like protein